MSHEIRTPLNGIVGYAAVLASSPDLPAKHRRHASVISNSSKALVRIVDDVLDFSALDANEVSFDIRPFDPAELVRATVEALQVQASAREIDLHVSVDSGVPLFYLGDDDRIRQILMNLVGNAIKFTTAGRVEVRCEPVLDGSDQTFRCSVKDTGIGIPADKIDSLFSRFTQADTTISRRYGGSGLGLAITRKIVSAMGGAVGVNSEEGVGSTFWFTLPLAQTSSEAVIADADRTEAKIHPRRVLLVDDHDINRELAALLLTPLGHEVILAASGEEAVQLFEREGFDLIFMDVQMPGMNGFDATREIRKKQIGKPVPIIALTAHAMREQIESCILAGMDGHVAKPFGARDLQNAIAKWTGPERMEASKELDPSDLGPEISALRQRFVERTADDLKHFARLENDTSSEARAEVQSLIHRLAGTAGSLGFVDVGNLALSIDASLTSGKPPTAGSLDDLLAALSLLQKRTHD